MATVKTEKVNKWREHLSGSRLPVFSRTVRDVRTVATSHVSSADDLSDVIGQDASMAARVIQIANSPLFNLQNREIDTISAAVVMVGFDAVREIAITVGVIEEMLKGSQHHRVGRHMALAFHAAAQARAFARHCGGRPDEVFVAALLRQVGEMAFWSRAGREANAIEMRLKQGMAHGDAEKEVLGFELSELSKGLAQDWHLGELLGQVLGGIHVDDPAVQNVELGHEVARVLDEHEWRDRETQELLERLASHLNVKRDAVEQLVRDNLEEAAKIADRFGVSKLEEELPVLPAEPGSGQLGGNDEGGTAPTPEPPGEAIRQADPELLMRRLSELARALEDGETRDELMQRLLLAMEDGIGCRRAWFALLTPARDKLAIKYATGIDTESVIGTICKVGEHKLLAEVLEQTGVEVRQQFRQQAPLMCGGPCAVVGVRIGERSVGVLYMENVAAADFTQVQIDGFRQLGQQIALILSQASG